MPEPSLSLLPFSALKIDARDVFPGYLLFVQRRCSCLGAMS
jgi:hypothetical protein